MSVNIPIPTADELVGALDALDVPFLTNGVQNETALALTPSQLFQGLAASDEARVRSAIIPLLLRHPEFAAGAAEAAASLSGEAQYTLQLFYTAAMLLQQKYAVRLGAIFGAQLRLPDRFSQILEIALPASPGQGLTLVGNRNSELSGLIMNWTGGYEHAARTWLEYIELQVTRNRRQVWQLA